MSSAPGWPGCPPPCALAEARRRRSTLIEAARPGRRALPLLPRSAARHDHRQRQSPRPVRQPRGARLSSRTIGARRPPGRARTTRASPSATCATGARWTLRPNAGPLPWWMFAEGPPRAGHQAGRLSRRCRACCSAHGRPDDRRRDAAATARCGSGCSSRSCWRRSTPPAAEGSAALAGAVVRETLARAARACRPRSPTRRSPPPSSIPPSPTSRRTAPTCGSAAGCARSEFDGGRVVGARLRPTGAELVAPDEPVVLAVPPWVAPDLLPGLTRARRVPRHRQRAFPHPAAGRRAADASA